jgi:hypothetical protein
VPYLSFRSSFAEVERIKSRRWSTAPRRSGHQVDVDFVEPLCVDIELDIGQAQVGRNLGGRIPRDRLAVTSSVIDVDVHVELRLYGDRTGHHRDVRAAHDLEQAQGVCHFFVAPLVSADYCNSEDFNLGD